MKRQLLTSFALGLATLLAAQTPEQADSTGLPGDDFSLQGALEVFKQCTDLETFEQALNRTDSPVNNLDLDGDEQVDYIRVVSHKDGEAMAIVMQVAVSQKETQDIAVIELERTGEGSALAQIMGDEELYPTGTIIEPFAEEEQMKYGNGPTAPELLSTYVTVNVWGWAGVSWCYGPHYTPWVSPWYWSHFPPWWRPWRRHPWHVWYGWGRPYRGWYRPWPTCRVGQAHAMYMPHRSTSVVVHTRNLNAHARYASSHSAVQHRSGTGANTKKQNARSKAEKPFTGTTPNATTPPVSQGKQQPVPGKTSPSAKQSRKAKRAERTKHR